MMKSTLLIFLTVFMLGTIKAQKNDAFFGQKNLFEVNYAVYANLVSSPPYYERQESQLVQKDIGFRHSLQLVYTKHLLGKMAFGFEFDYGKGVYGPIRYQGMIDGSTSYFNVERINMNYMAFIGKFEFGRRGGLFPIGVSHQVGGGLLVIAPKAGSVYAVGANHNDVIETRQLDYTLEGAKGITGFYNLNFRAALSDRLLLNFGLRYNFNYVFPANSDSQYFINEGRMVSAMNQSLGMNFMRFYTGLGFSF